ncbi:MAG: SRPBCC domain-containing protein [Reyranella sp.]|uniref:SRPBCC family protein n=1 Tax=Reyranella sp. TaxID=1929291 RepID=UPI001ACC8A3F|nr:SRPBCC domain-containing protein [Reyranella sp.]MBN9085526.1 SRPBCC domain-containing protein [Reyranella sp.]
MAAALDDKTLRIVRVFNAPRERVFDAWVVEDNFIQWMCPPNVHVDEVKLDVRPGGAWHLRGRNASRNFVTSGRYVEVKRPERLVFTWAHHATDDKASPRGHETTVHLELRALGDKTELTLIHGPFADTPSCNAHFEGWTGSLDKLEPYLRRTA